MFYPVVYIDKGLGFALPSQGWSSECVAAGVQTLPLVYLESEVETQVRVLCPSYLVY